MRAHATQISDKVQKFSRVGALALDPKALFFWFDEFDSEEFESVGDVAVVSITGPLEHHDGWWWDSYDSIRERVLAACKSSATTVLLKIDSPGGDVSGCFETARALRAMATESGKKLIAYADGSACSAAYALACAAESIFIPETGAVGSIGVINTSWEFSKMNAELGITATVLASGERKADGHPDIPMTDDAKASIQAHVDELAETFFALVGEMRPSLPAKSAKALEAGVFYGATAVSKGLADQVLTFDEVLALHQSEQKEKQAMSAKQMKASLDDARSALEEAAKGEGDEAEAAKRALAALDEEPEEEAETEDPPADEEEEAADEEDPPADEEEEASAAAAAQVRGTPGAGQKKSTTKVDLAALVQKQGAELAEVKRTLRARSVKKLLAARPDLTPELRKVLASKPVKEVKAILAGIPKPKVPTPAAAAGVQGTRGVGQDGRANRITTLQAPEAASRMDQRMRLTRTERVVENDGAVLRLGVTKVKGA